MTKVLVVERSGRTSNEFRQHQEKQLTISAHDLILKTTETLLTYKLGGRIPYFVCADNNYEISE